uniref:Uncharacterized protein n=1 Tax=Anguilla anguilla TaxID=7936 RepID=A0A0E9V4I3_ANGAN
MVMSAWSSNSISIFKLTINKYAKQRLCLCQWKAKKNSAE